MAGQPPLIGVTGAIGAGKSSVLQAFALRGCACLSADAVVHNMRPKAAEKLGLHPSPNGSILRILELPPGAPALMHRTDTIDYVLQLEGECDMILDDDKEVHMNQGDVMIQRGTWHGWANRSNKTCRIAFVLVDAVKLGNIGGHETSH